MFKKTLTGILILLTTVVLVVMITIAFSVFRSANTQYERSIGQSYPAAVIYKNAQIIDPLSGQTSTADLLVEKKRIKAIGSLTSEIYPNATVIDLENRYVVPGLIDAHVHIFDHTDLTAMLAKGVTTVRNMMGFPIHLKWKQDIQQGLLDGPLLYTASPTLNSGSDGGPFHKKIQSLEQLKTIMHDYAQQGYDFYKFYDGLSKEQFTTLVTEAKRWNKGYAGHLPHSLSLRETVASKPDSLEHVEDIFNNVLGHKTDKDKLLQVANILAEAQQTYVPTHIAYHNIFQAGLNYSDFMSPQRRDKINPFVGFIAQRMLQAAEHPDHIQYLITKDAFLTEIVRCFYQQGVPMALGTDTGPAMTIPGEAYHAEISLMRKAGLSNLDVLRMATINAAKLLRDENLTGQLTVGTYANFIVLDNNPLENLDHLRAINKVVVQGIFYDTNTLSALTDRGNNKSDLFTTVGYFMNHLWQL